MAALRLDTRPDPLEIDLARTAVVVVDMGAQVRATPLTLALVPARHGRPARLAARHVHEEGGTLHTPEAFELGKENAAINASAASGKR